MPDYIVSPLASYIINTLLAALVGLLIGWYKKSRRERDTKAAHDEAMEMGMRAVLRQQLIDYHAEYVATGKACPVRIKEQATSVYKAYNALGGNGTGTRLWQEIMSAHVMKKENKNED